MAYVCQPHPNSVLADDRYVEQPPPYRAAADQNIGYQPLSPNLGPGSSLNGGPYGQGQERVYHMHNTGEDYESPFKNDSMQWDDKMIRNAFVKKVYLLVFCMLTVTIATTAIFLLVPSVRSYVTTHSWVYWTSWLSGFGVIIALSFCENARRKTPTNYILLSAFTVAESFMVATISAWYETGEVLVALGITAGVVLAMTAFACQTKYDVTGWAIYLWGISWALLLCGIFAVFIQSKVINMVYAGAGALLFSIYLIVDTQMLLGGRDFEISPEEYVFGALAIFLDIINIFIMILSLLGQSNN